MSKVRSFLFLSSFLLSWCIMLHAQTVPTVIAQHYTTDDGLPSNNVQCVLKGSDGWMWLGTWYGLCRFDGKEFTTYNKPVHPQSANPPRKIESMAEDARGRLWLKTVDWKLYTFNPRTGCFKAVNHELKRHTRHIQVIKIQATADGHVLLLTKDKTLLLATTDERGETVIRKLFDSSRHIDRHTLHLREDVTAQSNGYSFYIGRDYRLFLMRSTGSPSTITTAMQQETAQQRQRQEQLAHRAAEAGIDKFLQLYQDKDSLLWVTTVADGIYCITTPQRLFQLIQLPDNDQTGVRAIYQLRQGTLLVGARSRNVYLFRPDGTLEKTLDYAHYGIGAVYHAMEDYQGRLWLSTKGDGLVVIPSATVPGASAPGFSATIPGAATVPGASAPGLLRHYRHDPSDSTTLSGNNVYTTLIDSHRHIWVGTLDGGLNLVKEETSGDLSFYNKDNGFAHYPSYGLYNEVRNMVEDPQGHLWVGTIDGLMGFDSQFQSPDSIIFHTSQNMPNGSFDNNDIYTLYRDHSGQVWMGAFGGGLQKLRFDEQTQRLRFEPLGAREGLRNDVVYSLQEDQNGRLWLATETGLACYNPQTGRVRNFDRYDGLPAVKMEEAAATCSRDGRLWIGCKEGILIFNPDKLQESHSNYRTFITDLLIDNESYAGAQTLPYTEAIELDYDQNAFSIEFAALNYQHPRHANYRYRLEGFDRDWRYSGNRRTASYNEVPPGRYTFVVETLDEGNPTLQSTATLSIRILPPWWATWWAYLIYCVVALCIAWLVVRTILQMNRMRNEVYISQRLAKLTAKPDEGDVFIDRLHRIIRENIPNGDFVIDDMASEMGLSRSAFYKKVKGQTGFAPVDLIKEFRLSHAAELLQTTNLTITEVAYRSGFKDASYFGKCFRKRYGMSPSEYCATLTDKQ